MSVTRSEMKKEALARMVMLHLRPDIIRDFDNEGRLYKSCTQLFNFKPCIRSVIPAGDEELKLVQKFEKEHGGLVYNLIFNITNFGVLLTLLYVSPYEEEWEQDRVDINERTPLAYVYNMTVEELSEFGSVGVESVAGGLIRIS